MTTSKPSQPGTVCCECLSGLQHLVQSEANGQTTAWRKRKPVRLSSRKCVLCDMFVWYYRTHQTLRMMEDNRGSIPRSSKQTHLRDNVLKGLRCKHGFSFSHRDNKYKVFRGNEIYQTLPGDSVYKLLRSRLVLARDEDVVRLESRTPRDAPRQRFLTLHHGRSSESGYVAGLRISGNNEGDDLMMRDGASPSPLQPILDNVAIKAWLVQSQLHQPSAASGNALFNQGFRLIDCVKECLVFQHKVCSYLALSYVWGELQPSWLITSTANISDLSKPFGLSQKTKTGARLPKIIADAIKLTRDLGFRYLWVDFICIIQDDKAGKQHLINRMDQVYHHASVTVIVPGCRNADEPLPGVSRQ